MTAVLSRDSQSAASFDSAQLVDAGRSMAAPPPPQPSGAQIDDPDGLVLNTGFDFQTPLFCSAAGSPASASSADARRRPPKRKGELDRPSVDLLLFAVRPSDHVLLENGERVVVVDPNVSEDEEAEPEEERDEAEEQLQQQTGPVSSASTRSSASPLPSKRRKPDLPQRASTAAGPPRKAMLTQKRPNTSAATSTPTRRPLSAVSVDDSGLGSGDEAANSTSASSNSVSVPAHLLKLLWRAAAGELDMAELLSRHPELLQALGDALPSCSTKSESTTFSASTLAKLGECGRGSLVSFVGLKVRKTT